MTTLAITDIASGFSSGYTTISSFKGASRYNGCPTWAKTSWEALKTTVKAHNLTTFPTQIGIWATFAAWTAIYSASSITAYAGNAPYGCGAMYKPNCFIQHAPTIILITRLALTALEYTVHPRKALAALVTMVAYTTLFTSPNTLTDVYLPIAANITILVLGSPLEKALVVTQAIGSLLF